MELHLVRHGQTDYNLADRYQGSIERPLNAQGVQQANDLVAQLPRDIDLIVVSPQQRARQTAQPAIDALGAPVLVMEAFRERELGAWEGLTRTEARALDPAYFDSNGMYAFDRQPPGAESVAAVLQRTGDALRELLHRYSEQRVLLVTHGFVIRALRYQLEGLPPAELGHMARPANGELYRYDAAQLQRWATARDAQAATRAGNAAFIDATAS